MAISAVELLWHKALRLCRRLDVGRMTRRGTFELLESRILLASNWTALANSPPTEIQTMELLTNGTVMAATYSDAWYLLTPSVTGSYVNGTWSELANEPTQRLYYGSAVMQNGNFLVVGGEYINGSKTATDSNTGEIYNPATNSWSSITPFPRSEFGDDPTKLLENGEILSGYINGPKTYLYNIASNTWTETGTKNNDDSSSEENWVMLPDDSVLSYDIFYNTGSEPGLAQRYIPSTGTWVNTGTVPVALSDTSEYELGPNALLPNGDVIQIGGNSNTAIFDPTTDSNSGGTWSAGPVIPGGYVSDDAPGVLLPNGQFLFTADLPEYTKPTHVFDYDYTNNTISDITPSVADGDPADLVTQLGDYPSYSDRFLMLPNGQALFTVGEDSQLYVSTGTGSVNSSSTPSISGITSNGSNSYTLTGSALNGASQGATYGDDAEMDTNYPIVSVATNIGTTYYAETTNWNMTGVGVTDGATSVNFALPGAISAPPSVTSDALDATSGQPLNNVTVATFTDNNGDFTGDYAATIDWGDGTETTGTITGPNGSGVYTVTGSHSYTEQGAETLTVSIVDNYASGQLSVSGSGVSATPTTFNLAAAGRITFTVASPRVTTTSLDSSVTPSTYGQSVSFVATVDNTSGSGGVPTGSVEFFDGTTELGAGTPLSGSGTSAISAFSIATLAAGTHSISAVYTATGGFVGSNGTLSQAVNQAVLTVAGITSANKVYNANATAALNTSSAALVGVLGDDMVTLGTGNATGTFASKSMGTGITVTVAGLTISGAQASDYALTQPTTTANITPASLTVSGITAANKVYNADTVAILITLSATLLGVFSGDAVNLNSGGATGNLANENVGTGITVAVAGLTISGAQASDYALTQPTTTADITPATPTVAVSDAGGTFNGFRFNATATVTGVGGSPAFQLEGIAPTPEYYAGSTATGTPLTAAPIDAGTYTIVATFPGSADYAPNASQPITFTIFKATPALTLSATGGEFDGAPFAASVKVTGSGSNDSPSASLEGVTPSVAYYDGTGTSGTSLGSMPPSAAGTYTVVAGFAGSADYSAVQSTPSTFTIRAGGSIIAVTPLTGSAAYGQLVAFVATVTAVVIPSGTVTFLDDGNTLGIVALDGSGTATLPTSVLTVGSHTITATYSGDTDLAGARSQSASESVGQVGTTVVFNPHPVLKKKKVVSEVLTAEIESRSPGGTAPTGIVTFELLTKKKNKLVTTRLGIAPVSGGDATLTVKATLALSKAITIVYSGDTDFMASTLAAPKLSKNGLL